MKSKYKKDVSESKAPTERVIPLLAPVRIYTAVELAAMPLSVMNRAIDAQEKFYLLEHTTKMGGASYKRSSPHGKWRDINSSEREITDAIQNQKSIHSTSYCSSVRNAWTCKVGSPVNG